MDHWQTFLLASLTVIIAYFWEMSSMRHAKL